jgi:L-ascorbate metabolism protein UlaG (beta-lactamase superfamily)
MTDLADVSAALRADLAKRRIPDEALGLWWLGQASFILKGGGATVYVDPYLAESPRRIVPPPLRPEEVTDADLILCTHDHGDHIDPKSLPGIAAASPRAPIVVPGVARERVIAMGIDAGRVVVPPVDAPLTFGPITVTAIPAAHEGLDYTPERGYPYLGYVIRLNGVVAYHSGDCCMYDGLIERLRQHKPDVAMLPINGHDWKRLHERCIGNMTYREAADLADEADIDVTIPMHYGMFRNNHEPPGAFANYVLEFYPQRKIQVMARYGAFTYLK